MGLSSSLLGNLLLALVLSTSSPSVCATGSSSTSNNVQWLDPTPGASLSSGQSMLATWRSDAPISSPSFSLCTAEQSCGDASWPNVVDNGDGSSSASLALPDMNSLSGMYMLMKGDDESLYASPSFDVGTTDGAVSSGDAAMAAVSTVSASYSHPTDSVDLTTKSASSVTASNTASDATPVKHSTSNIAVYHSPSSINTAMATTIPSQTASAPYMIANTAQLPQSLPYSFASSIVDPTQTSLSDSSLSTTHAASRPSAAAIAIPLAICALILLSALIFCARTRVARKPAAKNNDLEGRDWQAVIKEKAAAAKAGNNVVVTERIGERVIPPMDGNHYQDRGDRTSRNLRDGFHDGGFRGDRCMSEMSSRSGTRCLTPIRERERFTSIPTIDYGRHGRYGDRGSRCSLYSDSYHGHEPRKSWDYYTSSRRSSSSLGGVDEGFGPCAYHDRSSREKKDRGCIDCVREISHEGSIYNPHPARPMRQASSHSHSHTRPLPPLPEPMIRSSSSSTFQEQEQEWMATKKFGYLPPHKSGVLQRASSNASTDTNPAWKRDMRVGTGGGAGYGRYEDGEKGMGELYESLIRAIGTPR